MVKKVKPLFAWFILITALAGCGRADSDLAEPEETIREMILAKDASATWTRSFASASPQKPPQIALQPDNLAATSAAVLGNPVYPSLPRFASLDRSNLSPDVLTVIDGFCTALSSGSKENARSRMHRETGFFVDIIFLDLGITTGRSPFITRHLVGKPEVISETWQVPVRLFTRADEHLDIQMYLIYDSGQWVVDQITYGELVRESTDD